MFSHGLAALLSVFSLVCNVRQPHDSVWSGSRRGAQLRASIPSPKATHIMRIWMTSKEQARLEVARAELKNYLPGYDFAECSRRYWVKLLAIVAKSDGIMITVVLLFSAPTSEIICMRRSSSAAGLSAI